MKRKMILAASIAALLIGGCDTDPIEGGTYHTIDIVKENSWRSDSKRYQVITTQEILDDIFEDNDYDIDFSAYDVLAVSLGTTPLEYEVEVTEALEKEDYVQITTEASRAADDCDIDEGFIYPSQIVKIPKLSKDIVFKENYRVKNCNGLNDYLYQCDDASSGTSISYTTLKSGNYYFEDSDEDKQIQLFESSDETLAILYESLSNEELEDLNGTVLYINSGTHIADDKYTMKVTGVTKADTHLKISIKTTAPDSETCDIGSLQTNLFQFINIPSTDYNITDIMICESYEIQECNE